MRYAIRIDSDSQNFIAQLNGGVIPQTENKETFFILGDENTPNEILSRDEMVRKLGTNYEMPFIAVSEWTNPL